MVTQKQRRRWTDELVLSEVKEIGIAIGKFPSRQDLENMGRGDLGNAIAKRGGFMHWAKISGFGRASSASDTGWQGEKEFADMCLARGLKIQNREGVKCPYDLVVNDRVRIDVKSARMANYGAGKGWYYRIGKYVQADVVVLYQLDTGDFYALHWARVGTTNITVSLDSEKLRRWKNNWGVVTGEEQ